VYRLLAVNFPTPFSSIFAAIVPESSSVNLSKNLASNVFRSGPYSHFQPTLGSESWIGAQVVYEAWTLVHMLRPPSQGPELLMKLLHQ
jgi:hypothetical protein